MLLLLLAGPVLLQFGAVRLHQDGNLVGLSHRCEGAVGPTAGGELNGRRRRGTRWARAWSHEGDARRT